MKLKSPLIIATTFLVGFIFPFYAHAQDNKPETAQTHELQELVVTADRNLFKVKGPNKFVYEVYKDSTLINANTLDALSRVPIMAVKKTGSIEAISGRELVFRLNGLRDPILRSLNQALTAIPADVIKTIEFREDNNDEGRPVLEVNIVTKGRLEGYRLQLNSFIRDYGWRNGAWAMTKAKRLAINGGYFNNWEWGHKSTSGRREYREDTPMTYFYSSDSEDEGYKTDMHDFQISASYDVDDRSFISVYGRAMIKDNPHMLTHESTSIFDREGNLSASFDNVYRINLNRDNEYHVQIQYERDLTKNRLRGNLNIGYEFYSRPIDQINNSTYNVTQNNIGDGLDFLNLNDSRRRKLNSYVTNTIVANWSKEINRNMKWEVSGKARSRNERYSNEVTMNPVLTEEPSYSESYSTSLLEH